MRSFLLFSAILSATWAAENDALTKTNQAPAAAQVPAAAVQPPPERTDLTSLEDARAILANAMRSISNSAPATVSTTGANAATSVVINRDILDDAMKLHAGDVVRYRVVEDKEPTIRLPITDGGEIEIPYVGYVKAVGKTCKELATEVKQLLEQDFYHSATVNIAIETVLRKSLGRVWVYGAVSAPGAQEIPQDEPWTVSKAVLRAGPTEFANKGRVKLKKGGALSGGANPAIPPIDKGKKDEFIYVDVDEIYRKGRSEKDVPVEPGDAIIVDALVFNLGR